LETFGRSQLEPHSTEHCGMSCFKERKRHFSVGIPKNSEKITGGGNNSVLKFSLKKVEFAISKGAGKRQNPSTLFQAERALSTTYVLVVFGDDPTLL